MSQLSKDPQQNYQSFIEDILKTGKVWGVRSDEGWVVCDSAEFEETDVMPFWSAEIDAKAQCSDEWAGNRAEAIELETFIDDWLTGMAEDGVLIGPNWTSEMDGLEIEPVDLARQLLEDSDS